MFSRQTHSTTTHSCSATAYRERAIWLDSHLTTIFSRMILCTAYTCTDTSRVGYRFTRCPTRVWVNSTSYTLLRIAVMRHTIQTSLSEKLMTTVEEGMLGYISLHYILDPHTQLQVRTTFPRYRNYSTQLHYRIATYVWGQSRYSRFALGFNYPAFIMETLAAVIVWFCLATADDSTTSVRFALMTLYFQFSCRRLLHTG